ncbi:MAG: hypothetical protein KGJ59_01185 [Bacteroidota bacterium]|nr:hypothetical protein [Bacteroidota bacterium]
MINWQQIVSLLIVGGAFFWLVWSKVRRKKNSNGEESEHCASCAAAEAFRQKNAKIH